MSGSFQDSKSFESNESEGYGSLENGESFRNGTAEETGSAVPERIKYDAAGLVPAIVQDVNTKQVLMLGYMNEESLKLTLSTGRTWFFSRSRGKLWNKGETSGHFQNVVEVRYDCDCDAVLVIAEQIGAACHTGNFSCFYRKFVTVKP